MAFRHSSSAEEIYESNERLEFLGDAVLGAVIADYLFKKFPYKDEGYLTDIRSKMVSRSQLKTVSHKMGIDLYLSYSSADPLINKKSLTGNALEALVGAVYLDKGYKSAYNFIIKKIVKPFLDIGELEISEFNYKSKLLELRVSAKAGKDGASLIHGDVLAADAEKAEALARTIEKLVRLKDSLAARVVVGSLLADFECKANGNTVSFDVELTEKQLETLMGFVAGMVGADFKVKP